MVLTLFVVFVVAPVIELGVFLEVASLIGVWPAVLLVLAFSALGVVVVRRAGARAWRRTRDAWSRGQIPSAEMGDGFLLGLAGLLLILPGFLTDVLGLLLLVPPIRAFVRRRFVKRWMEGRSVPTFLRSRSVVDVQWIGDVTPRGGATAPLEIGPGHD